MNSIIQKGLTQSVGALSTSSPTHIMSVVNMSLNHILLRSARGMNSNSNSNNNISNISRVSSKDFHSIITSQQQQQYSSPSPSSLMSFINNNLTSNNNNMQSVLRRQVITSNSNSVQGLGLRLYSSSTPPPTNTGNAGNTPPTTPTTPTTPTPAPAPKESLMEKIRKVAKHYWLGTKLLGKNIVLTVKLLRRLSNGHTLSRRERSLLVQTSADTLRLVPFIIIMVVPFLEFALPFLLKLFPKMLPSTYEHKNDTEKHKTSQEQVNVSMAKFLQDTLSDISVELKGNNIVKSTEFHDFMTKVKMGQPVSSEEILTFSQLFRDEITMEKISRPQLLAMHKYLAGGSFVAKWYSNDYLRQQINKKLKKIKQDDILIRKEGLDSLTLEELVDAAIVRGFKVEGYGRKQIEHQLEQWLDLSLNKSVPSSLLILSRAFTLANSPSKPTSAEHLEEVLEHIPQEALDEVVKKLPVGGAFEAGSVERAEEKLEELTKEQALLEKEEKEEKEAPAAAAAPVDATVDAKVATTTDSVAAATADATVTAANTTTTTDATTPQPEQAVPKVQKPLTLEQKKELSLSDDDDAEIHQAQNNNNNNNVEATTTNPTQQSQSKQ
ncbi:hypothetical protein SAMD00019534_024470 [Acytostelium subglobosum LB1]|uniref:hypothetical protein n=1 Tax=Acytostelium subglobosum LB1 TaxID=1410327 RepID=UPI000644847F|nr:hypothetical protein SAMD00019534_024470 [Acytostelium subglobosum LB1]GAM19272.1 hypothetical protein SAMD00019534_024470 [Acytostelium subglobosum LB1]|eukprot:XP_012757199.1 hypothetical protein SAMD00019534_024470 [Acytostelium subglobosum LB1]